MSPAVSLRTPNFELIFSDVTTISISLELSVFWANTENTDT